MRTAWGSFIAASPVLALTAWLCVETRGDARATVAFFGVSVWATAWAYMVERMNARAERINFIAATLKG